MPETSLLDAALQFSQTVRDQSPRRPAALKLVEKIRTDRPALWAAALQKPYQFADLLIHHAAQAPLNPDFPYRLEDRLTPEEVVEVENAFSDYHLLNRLCLDPLVRRTDWLLPPLLPYGDENFVLPEVRMTQIPFGLPGPLIRAFTERFWQHPAFAVIRSHIGLLDRLPFELFEKSRKQVELGLEKDSLLQAAGPEATALPDPASPQGRYLQLFSALTSLKKSLQVLNEMLFLYTLNGDLPNLSEVDLPQPPEWVETSLGRRATLSVIHGDALALVWLIRLNEAQGSSLCFIRQKKTRIADAGEALELTAAQVSDQLNPYVFER